MNAASDIRRLPSNVVLFPMAARIWFVAAVARNLLDRTGEKREKRWRLELGRVETEMMACGIYDRERIRAEQISFAEAVDAEVRRLIAANTNDRDDGVA